MASREDNGPTGGATHHDDPANAKTKRTLFKKKTRKVSTLLHDKTASRKSRLKLALLAASGIGYVPCVWTGTIPCVQTGTISVAEKES